MGMNRPGFVASLIPCCPFASLHADQTQSGNATVVAPDVKDHAFQTSVRITPDTWSGCVNSSGKVPLVVIKTTVLLSRTETEGGKFSGGTVGGDKTDLKKALTLHFQPEWRTCS